MNKLQKNTNVIVTIVGIILITASSTRSQQLQLSAIAEQPQDQLAQVGTDVTLSFGAPNVLQCQWLCNGIEIDGQTTSMLTITNVQPADAGYYSCVVASSSALEETASASLEVYTFDSDFDVVVFAAPIVSSGSSGSCPGPYKGYVNYTKTAAQGWGWTPSTNATVYTASDNNRTNTKVEYLGAYGDSGCSKMSVTVQQPLYSPVYRFTIYFTNNVPTTNYSITLSGFNP